ncbi:MAG: S1C family serine protease [Candidatus Saccharicenans sp.]|uniref:S1C family serine protease n=1 Tax=Candidatus Saccharicenans sp. TaxID=2819258 RepID=UPI004049ED92
MKRPGLLAGTIAYLFSSIAFAQTLSIEKIINNALPSVVKIVVYDITGSKRAEGSGFFIGPGKILTNAHVIDRAYSASVQSSLKLYENITIIKRDDDLDLALLLVEDAGEPALPLAEASDLRPGQRVLAIGNPLGFDQTVSDGLISAIRGIPGKIQIIQTSAPVSPGSSGGPLLDLKGEVIGVISATVSEGQNLNFAIGIETLKQFLQRPDNPVPLKKAGTRVLWRIILKWVIAVVLGIIAFVFGGGWWIIAIVIMVLYAFIHLLKGFWGLITLPFRRKTKPGAFSSNQGSYFTNYQHMPATQVSILGEEKDELNEEDEEELFYFHCWKCGSLVQVDKANGQDTIKCKKCGTRLQIPAK